MKMWLTKCSVPDVFRLIYVESSLLHEMTIPFAAYIDEKMRLNQLKIPSGSFKYFIDRIK